MPRDLVIFVFDHFYPDFTAGGPVRSLHNLSQLLKDNLEVRILTSAFEYGSGRQMQEILTNQWTNLNGISICYATSRSSFKKALNDLPQNQRSIFYLNGIFSTSYFLYLLWLLKEKKRRVIVSPRGMLQSGALQGGALKKRIYLTLLKWSSLLNNVEWHATDSQELLDIQNRINSRAIITVIPNVPVIDLVKLPVIEKNPGELQLVYFSLISKKKNLHFILNLLRLHELQNIRLTIIGPVKDEAYWKMCKKEIEGLPSPGNIIYKGEITPESAPATLAGFHALVLPTLGENFGHAIVEMLSVSRPVIISDKTPWVNLEKYNAGYSLPLEEKVWRDALLKMLNWNGNEFNKACSAALQYYHHKFDIEELKMKYLNLFNTDAQS